MTVLERIAADHTETHVSAIFRRVVDCFIREDYRGLSSSAHLVERSDLPQFLANIANATQYLSWPRPEDAGQLFIAVQPCSFQQDWKVAELPLWWADRKGVRGIASFTELMEVLQVGLEGEALDNARAYLEECLVAAEHAVICAQALPHALNGHDTEALVGFPGWHRRMLANDRRASLCDHPFYPTARAKLGFGEADVRSYGPEHGTSFSLNWIALPREGLWQQGKVPDCWPTFAEVGLDPALEQGRILFPVHPFMWGERLDAILREAGLEDAARRAPRSWLDVVPTLSVRSVAVRQDPGLHIKLPLAMRTLGRLNLRAIKPSTIHDGHAVQTLLTEMIGQDPWLGNHLHLTDESGGACHSDQPFLAYILRRFPTGLHDSEAVPAAGLAAPGRDGRLLMHELIDRYFGGDADAFFTEYFELLLGVHLRLWARNGIALEANQQNSVLLFSGSAPRLRLLLKDNDGPRIDREAFRAATPDLAASLETLRDKRIGTADEEALAQMFITITLQLNLGAIIMAHAQATETGPHRLFAMLRSTIEDHLLWLEAEDADCTAMRRALLQSDRLPIKYLLRAASLESRSASGAADVNKFYGLSAPNFLIRQPLP